jgi:putative transposase
VLIDAIYVKIREGQVGNRPVYVALGVNLAGDRDLLGMWVGAGGEGAKHWTACLAELRNPGVQDVCIVACDGLKGAAGVGGRDLAPGHRAAVRGPPRRGQPSVCVQGALGTDHQSTAGCLHRPDGRGRRGSLRCLRGGLGGKYPVITKLWRSAWEQFTPFLAFPAEVRRVVHTINAIESLNSRFRQATRRRGHFPNEQAALKVLYQVIRRPRPNRANVTGKTGGWSRPERPGALLRRQDSRKLEAITAHPRNSGQALPAHSPSVATVIWRSPSGR